MKKILFLLAICSTLFSNAQSRGVRIGYIDMDYILEKVPEYAEANNQLTLKTVKWKQEIEVKKNAIQKLKDELNAERALLTKELIEEREEEIAFQEKDLIDYQEKRFGPRGDLMIQKTTLVKPIQDQVFTAIQDIAEQKKYDFIFDKSSDLTMLFAAQRFDISDQVVRILQRSQKREELSKKQLKKLEAQEAIEDMQDENPELAERQKALDDKKAAREKLLEKKKAERDSLIAARKAAAEEKRQKILEERNGNKNGTVIEKNSNNENDDEENLDENKVANPPKEVNQNTVLSAEEKRKQLAEERQRKLDERKKALEEKKQKALEEREAAKKAKEEDKKTE